MKNKYDQFLKNYLKEDYSLVPLEGGANNRVFAVKIKDNTKFVLKHYFTHPNDKRNRLFAERSFLLFAWKNHIRNIPEPLFFDTTSNIALLSFIENRSFHAKDLNQENVDKAADFFSLLNQKKVDNLKLPFASEACLSLKDYFYAVDRKINKLTQHLIDEDLRIFLFKELLPYWKAFKSKYLPKKSILEKKFPSSQLCITPSDFGFHNALITEEKKIYFIDFEYAGKDDPVKTLCDFFCQPKFSVSLKFFPSFFSRIEPVFGNSKEILDRFYFALPICQFKWCCIMLGLFSETRENREQFLQNKKSYLVTIKNTLDSIVS